MNRDQKAAVIEEIAGQLKESEAVFAVDYRGITVPQVAELRTKLRDADATFRVVKNSLTERAADEADAASLKELLDGPTALAFVRGDAATAAKALADYGRATDLLAFKGGLMDGLPLDPDQIKAISRLPSRQVLYGQLVGVVASPISGVVRTLNALIAGLASQLGQIADQGLVSGEAPAAEEAAPAAEEAPAEDAASEEAPAEEAAPAAEAAETPDAEPDQDAEKEPPAVQPDQAEGEGDENPSQSDETQADASADTTAEADKED